MATSSGLAGDVHHAWAPGGDEHASEEVQPPPLQRPFSKRKARALYAGAMPSRPSPRGRAVKPAVSPAASRDKSLSVFEIEDDQSVGEETVGGETLGNHSLVTLGDTSQFTLESAQPQTPVSQHRPKNEKAPELQAVTLTDDMLKGEIAFRRFMMTSYAERVESKKAVNDKRRQGGSKFSSFDLPILDFVMSQQTLVLAPHHHKGMHQEAEDATSHVRPITNAFEENRVAREQAEERARKAELEEAEMAKRKALSSRKNAMSKKKNPALAYREKTLKKKREEKRLLDSFSRTIPVSKREKELERMAEEKGVEKLASTDRFEYERLKMRRQAEQKKANLEAKRKTRAELLRRRAEKNRVDETDPEIAALDKAGGFKNYVKKHVILGKRQIKLLMKLSSQKYKAWMRLYNRFSTALYTRYIITISSSETLIYLNDLVEEWIRKRRQRRLEYRRKRQARRDLWKLQAEEAALAAQAGEDGDTEQGAAQGSWMEDMDLEDEWPPLPEGPTLGSLLLSVLQRSPYRLPTKSEIQKALAPGHIRVKLRDAREKVQMALKPENVKSRLHETKEAVQAALKPEHVKSVLGKTLRNVKGALKPENMKAKLKSTFAREKIRERGRAVLEAGKLVHTAGKNSAAHGWHYCRKTFSERNLRRLKRQFERKFTEENLRQTAEHCREQLGTGAGILRLHAARQMEVLKARAKSVKKEDFLEFTAYVAQALRQNAAYAKKFFSAHGLARRESRIGCSENQAPSPDSDLGDPPPSPERTPIEAFSEGEVGEEEEEKRQDQGQSGEERESANESLESPPVKESLLGENDADEEGDLEVAEAVIATGFEATGDLVQPAASEQERAEAVAEQACEPLMEAESVDEIAVPGEQQQLHETLPIAVSAGKQLPPSAEEDIQSSTSQHGEPSADGIGASAA